MSKICKSSLGLVAAVSMIVTGLVSAATAAPVGMRAAKSGSTGTPVELVQYNKKGKGGPNVQHSNNNNNSNSNRNKRRAAVGAAIAIGTIAAIAAANEARAERRGGYSERETYREGPSRWQCRDWMRRCDDGSGWACRRFDREC